MQAKIVRSGIIRLVQTHDPKLARDLVLDELFDLTLYRKLDAITHRKYKTIFDQLIPIEVGHLRFWQNFFNVRIDRLNFLRRVKLSVLVFMCRVFGAHAVHMIVEAIEVYGIRKYLRIWKKYHGTELGAALHTILEDEIKHENLLIAEEVEQKINPETIRGIFLGFNDGLTEMLGAVSGFFAAFQSTAPILIAGFTVTVAGAFSMAASAYVGVSSANEIAGVESERKKFLKQSQGGTLATSPFLVAVIVGFSYILGALIPLLPVFFGAKSVILSVIFGVIFVGLVSMVLAFLSGMNVMRRIMMNIYIIAIAVAVTYGIGMAVKAIFGISVP